MADTERAFITNEAKIAEFRRCGYDSVWIAGAGCCKACTELNGITLKGSFRPPLHGGCSCSVGIGESFRKEHLTYPKIPDKFNDVQELRDWIASKDCNKSIRWGEQNGHIVGTNEYKQYQDKVAQKGKFGPSILTIDEDTIKTLIEEYAGKGQLKIGPNGDWDKTEK